MSRSIRLLVKVAFSNFRLLRATAIWKQQKRTTTPSEASNRFFIPEYYIAITTAVTKRTMIRKSLIMYLPWYKRPYYLEVQFGMGLLSIPDTNTIHAFIPYTWTIQILI